MIKQFYWGLKKGVKFVEKNNPMRQQLQSFLDNKTDKELNEMINSIQTLMTYYKCAILEIETKFRVLNEQFSMMHERNPIESIRSRLKSMDSIREKLKRRNHEFSVGSIEENLSDIAGVRIICAFKDDIYMLADCLINQDDVKLIEKKDYIKNPKPNGYRSLHLIVEIPIFLQNEKKHIRVEVQLRTIAMESWANLEHRMRYKKNLPQELLEITNEELYECAKLSSMLDEKMQNIRNMIEK